MHESRLRRSDEVEQDMSVLYTTRAGIHRPSWQTGCGDKLSSETTRDASGESHSLSHHLFAQFSPTATMAVMTASAMIRGLSLFHVTLAALLLKNPAIVAKQGVVLVLGQSMQLVRPTSRPNHDLGQITQIHPPTASPPRLQQALGSHRLPRHPLRLHRALRPHGAVPLR